MNTHNTTILFSALILSIGLISINNVFGLFHEPKLPELPPIIEANHEYKDAFETLYTYHPDIEQWQIDGAYKWLNYKCLDQFEETNVFLEISCTAMNSGILRGVLENWNYTFINPTPTGQAPQLLTN